MSAAPNNSHEADPGVDAGGTIPHVGELLEVVQQTAGEVLEAEEALSRLRERFAQTEDPKVRGEIAVEALDHVERQLELTGERRQALDIAEAKLWNRRNNLEGYLIHTRGRAWWHQHRELTQSE